MAVDWLVIQNDYINDGGSYRELSKKYGVSFNTLQDRAKREDWARHKAENLDAITAMARQKTAEEIVKVTVKSAVKTVEVANELLRKTYESLQRYEPSKGKIKAVLIDGNKTLITEQPTLQQMAQTIKLCAEIISNFENQNEAEDGSTKVVFIDV